MAISTKKITPTTNSKFKSSSKKYFNKSRNNQSRKRNMKGGQPWFRKLWRNKKKSNKSVITPLDIKTISVKKEIHPDIMKIKDILESFKHVEELGLNKINLLKHAEELFNKGNTPEKVEANLKDAELRYM